MGPKTQWNRWSRAIKAALGDPSTAEGEPCFVEENRPEMTPSEVAHFARVSLWGMWVKEARAEDGFSTCTIIKMDNQEYIKHIRSGVYCGAVFVPMIHWAKMCILFWCFLSPEQIQIQSTGIVWLPTNLCMLDKLVRFLFVWRLQICHAFRTINDVQLPPLRPFNGWSNHSPSVFVCKITSKKPGLATFLITYFSISILYVVLFL